ncbi:MAG: DUF5013 domain-containing protein [Bacteroidaceae bacterium]|nr:DUF5013 domain-containing protein [Bacteroidaceae bacterium]
MRKKGLFTVAMLLIGVNTILAQDIPWNKEAYPDYDPNPHIDQTWVKQTQRRMRLQKAKGETRPDHWNNAESKAFPPVVNQSGGSCGSASRIYYMFTHEMNAMRGADGSLEENIYPTHFTWLLTWVPDQGKEIIAQHNGIPSSAVYGGRTYSEIFGYQDCDDDQSNYGWMQGYDKWYHAMHNRISGSGNFPYALNTTEGREMVKNYLWNHCGDERFSTGGIVGIGVAADCTTGKIPGTAKNKEIGVSGMNYVKYWGSSVNHALTIVGYDDRIEFDLDGNGISGEAEKDEVGAWIIVNSWGEWMNKGFIYCPYAEARPTKTSTSYWQPEYYTARWDYRPLRTLKVTMDYSRRSEMALYVGVAQDLNATQPEKSTFLRHFYYSGLGKKATTNPDPEIPMLGKWADGDLHSEPMEFGYDVTDLTSTFDLSRPLKYFFWVETCDYAEGEGHIYDVSIIDYNLDHNGIETSFNIPEGGTLVQNAGQRTELTAIVRSEVANVPRNLKMDGTTLSWQRPIGSINPVTYNIYQDGDLAQQVAADQFSTTTTGFGTFAVSAVYEINGYEVESNHSTPIVVRDGGFNKDNDVLIMKRLNEGFTLPDVTSGTLNAWTLEFWVRPNSTFPTTGGEKSAFGIKASSGKFFFKTNSSKIMEVGFDGGDFTTGTSLTTSKWSHIAIVEDGSQIFVYVNGKLNIKFTSGYNNSGLRGANDLIFGQSEGTGSNYKELINAPWEGYVDEIRFWNVARTQDEIKACYDQAFTYPMMQSGLTSYYQMNVNEDSTALVSAIGGPDVVLSNPLKSYPVLCNDQVNAKLNQLQFTASAQFKLSDREVVAGQPVTITDMSAPCTCEWDWTFTGAEQETLSGKSPIIVFTKPGRQAIHLTTASVSGETAEYSDTINVTEATVPVADFSLSTTSTAVGERVSFINQSTPLNACTYEWTFENAETTGASTTNAAATFTTTGTQRITLTATNSAGTNTCTKTISVEKVAPKPSFNIKNNIAILGEKIYLIDDTKYEPQQWMWNISSDTYALVMNGKEGSIDIDKPGVYNVSLTASNEKGSGTTTRSRAIVVCSADGGHGLAMGGGNDSGSSTLNNVVEATSPFNIARTRISIAFWLYPTNLVNGGNGIGSDPSTLLLTTNADGSMDFQASNKTGKSATGYVIANEWHHYAITYSSGTVTFYRDGVEISTATGLGSSIKKQSVLRIGGDYPFTGIIDELQMWSRALTVSEIQEYGSKPIEDPVNMKNGPVLYYQFNQTSGDVIDSSANGLTGVRSNFGPDGDAWASTKGIFFLNFESTKTDVTANYLKNYKSSFKTAGGYVNGTSRFQRLATETADSPWVIENAVTENGVTTCWHVDAQKGNSLVLSTKWDGFADAVKDLKLYQTITLEPGAYEFSISRYAEFITAGNYLVVAAGKGLPDLADINSSIAYSTANKPVNFLITETTEVSLGLVTSQSGSSCLTIDHFTLTNKEFGKIDANGETSISQTSADTPADGKFYDLSGRSISRPSKGIYIKDGRKVIIK